MLGAKGAEELLVVGLASVEGAVDEGGLAIEQDMVEEVEDQEHNLLGQEVEVGEALRCWDHWASASSWS